MNNLAVSPLQACLARFFEITETDPARSWRTRRALSGAGIEECRRLAAAAGFVPLGAMRWRPRVQQALALIHEVWADPAGDTFLRIGLGTYELVTRFADGTTIRTLGHRSENADSPTPERAAPGAELSYSSQGSFAKNTVAHRRRVALVTAARLPHRTLEDALAHAREAQRRESVNRQVFVLLNAAVTPILTPLIFAGVEVAAELGSSGYPIPTAVLLAFMLLGPAIDVGIAVLLTLATSGSWGADLLEEFSAATSARVVLRCPFCHDAAESPGAVCADCLARHHEECWSALGRCASCHGGRRFTGVSTTGASPDRLDDRVSFKPGFRAARRPSSSKPR